MQCRKRLRQGNTISMKMSFRFPVPEDAPAFARWAAENPDIPEKDMLAGTKENNPTATALVVEEELEDGSKVVRMFIPVYLTMRIAYLGFNPENTPKQTLQALDAMLPIVQGFARIWHINEVDTLTRSGLPMARWAGKHGFEAEDRELYTLKAIPPEGVH
jgi:hypothetical protein